MRSKRALSILVGVGGGIAAYKALDVVSALRKRGAQVTVLLSRNAHHFVAPLALQTLSGRPVGQDLFHEPAEWGVGHVTLARDADAMVIVAATANLLAKLSQGLADDFVSTAALVYHPKTLLLAPAMNTAMWQHPATQANLATLKARGAKVLDPYSGLLACGDRGTGKLVDPRVIVEAVWKLATGSKGKAAPAPRLPLQDKSILVNAGPTREPIDPVRYLSNPSSGKMGFALAEACRDLGAKVVLVSGPTALTDPAGIKTLRVQTALQMAKACEEAFEGCDAFIAAAAVSDFRPAKALDQKKKKGGPETLKLVPNPDILAGLAKRKGRRKLVGFAAETQDLLKHAAKKLKAKNLDLLVANRVDGGRGFGADAQEAWVLKPGRPPEALPLMSKADLARRVAQDLAALLSRP